MTPEYRKWFLRRLEANMNKVTGVYDYMGLEDDIWDKIQEDIKEEREACAKIALEWDGYTAGEIAKEIRERGEK